MLTGLGGGQDMQILNHPNTAGFGLAENMSQERSGLVEPTFTSSIGDHNS